MTDSDTTTLTAELIERLQQFNAWRRGDETIAQPSPAQIGRDIDEAISLLKERDQPDPFEDIMTDLDALLFVIECRMNTTNPVDHKDTIKLQHDIYEIAARIKKGSDQ